MRQGRGEETPRPEAQLTRLRQRSGVRASESSVWAAVPPLRGHLPCSQVGICSRVGVGPGYSPAVRSRACGNGLVPGSCLPGRLSTGRPVQGRLQTPPEHVGQLATDELLVEDPLFPIANPENRRRTLTEPHWGQGTFFWLSALGSSFSKVTPQASHRYSYSGIGYSSSRYTVVARNRPRWGISQACALQRLDSRPIPPRRPPRGRTRAGSRPTPRRRAPGSRGTRGRGILLARR